MDEQAYAVSLVYNPVHFEPTKDPINDENKRKGKCCGIISNREWSFFICFIEIAVSLAGLIYLINGIVNYPQYNPHILLLDEVVVEAQKHLRNPVRVEKMPEAQLFVNFFIFLAELFLAINLIIGVLNKSVKKVQFWLSVMLVYTLITTGVVLGFLIGGIHSNYLHFISFMHSFFRFSEIGIIYSYYEVLRQENREKRIFLANNNLDAVENAEAPPEHPQNVDDNHYPPPLPLGDSNMIGIATMPFI